MNCAVCYPGEEHSRRGTTRANDLNDSEPFLFKSSQEVNIAGVKGVGGVPVSS